MRVVTFTLRPLYHRGTAPGTVGPTATLGAFPLPVTEQDSCDVHLLA